MRGTYLTASRLSPFQSTFFLITIWNLSEPEWNGSIMKKFNTSLHGNLEKTKEILILSERTFAQSARSLIQNVDKMDCKYDLNHQWLHLKQ